MTTVADLSTVRYSGDLRADALLQPMPDWNFLLPARTTMYYTFDLGVIDSATEPALTPFNAAQRAAATQILSYVSSISGIPFVETASGAAADLHFGACDIAGDFFAGLTSSHETWTAMSDGTVTAYSAEAFIYLDNAEFLSTSASPVAGSSGYQVLLHEIGHALGLGHPFEGPFALPASLDNTDNTVMSYTPAGSIKSTFQAYDLLALRWIYGEDGLRGSLGFNSVYGPSLNPGGFESVVTGTAQADVLVGTGGRDSISGAAGNDALQGLGGDDHLDGGPGVDLAVYASTREGATLGRTGTGHAVASALDGNDTLTGIERLQFSDIGLALDVGADQSAGLTTLLLGAALPGQLVFDPSKQLLLGSVIGLFDEGYSLRELSGALLRLPVWDVLTGQALPSHRDIANYLLSNVHARAPDAGTLDAAVRALDTESFQGDWLADLASSPANQLHVGLVGLADTGLEFLPPQAQG